MKKRRKGKVRWLSVLLTGCLLLFIIPATAFAAEDTTIITENKDSKEEDSKTSEQPDTEEKSTTENASPVGRGVTDITGGETSNNYHHTYHTKIDTTAQVTIKDTDGNVKETTSVNKSGNFIEGNLSDEAVQAEITRIDNEIKAQFSSRGVVTIENRNGILEFDHFENDNILDNQTENKNVKSKDIYIREYQVYQITYDLIVQEPDAVDEVITTVDIGNVWKNLDSSQPVAFTAEVNPNNSDCSGKVEIVEETWEKSTYGESTPITDIIKSTDTPRNPIAGGEYWYSVKLKAKDGYRFSDNVTFICDGQTYTSEIAVSNDGKTFTAWEFMSPVTVSDGASNKKIGDVDIEGVTFNYEPGDIPKATAYKCDPWDEQYDIEYEYWEEMETNANGESVPVKYWYSDESKNNALAQDKKITTFEDGKTYMYSLSLKARNGNTFAANSKVMVNGTYVNNANVTNTGTGLFVVAVRTIKPETVQLQNISIVEINNATISFKVGDKPVFTGKTAENVPYIYQSEFWSTDGGKKYHYSADFWNDNNPDDLFTEFESGKTYTYGIYFKAKEGYCFTTDTKLKINGKYYDYDITDYDPLLQYPNGGYATMWVDTNLTMTPQASGTTPEYKITEGANSSWKQNSDGTLKFVANGDFSKFTGVKVDGTLVAADKYTAVSGSTVITLKKDYLSTLSVGKHTLTIVYNDGECSTEFEIKATSTPSIITNAGNNSGNTSSKVNKPDTSETTSPKTGDTSNMLLWFIVLLVSGSVTISTMMVHRKKQYNR